MTEKDTDFESITIYIDKEVLGYAKEQIQKKRWRNVSHAFEYSMTYVMNACPENVGNGD